MIPAIDKRHSKAECLFCRIDCMCLMYLAAIYSDNGIQVLSHHTVSLCPYYSQKHPIASVWEQAIGYILCVLETTYYYITRLDWATQGHPSYHFIAPYLSQWQACYPNGHLPICRYEGRSFKNELSIYLIRKYFFTPFVHLIIQIDYLVTCRLLLSWQKVSPPGNRSSEIYLSIKDVKKKREDICKGIISKCPTNYLSNFFFKIFCLHWHVWVFLHLNVWNPYGFIEANSHTPVCSVTTIY